MSYAKTSAVIDLISQLFNDAPKTCINALKLVCAGPAPPWVTNLEIVMQTIPEVPAQAIPEKKTNFALDLIAVVCGLLVVAFLCVATYGLDVSVGFF